MIDKKKILILVSVQIIDQHHKKTTMLIFLLVITSDPHAIKESKYNKTTSCIVELITINPSLAAKKIIKLVVS
jgi:hypothetical protein